MKILHIFLIFTIFYILFVLDIKYFYLPLPLNLCISVLGLTGNIFFSLAIEDSSYILNISPLFFSILGFIIGYSFLYLINSLYKIYKGIDGIGGGDFILFGGIGSIFGPLSLGPILFLSSSIGLMYFVLIIKMQNNKLSLGSFLILGSFCYFFLKTFELLENYLVLWLKAYWISSYIHIPWVLKAGFGLLFFINGAGDGIRTRTNSLEGYCASH